MDQRRGGSNVDLAAVGSSLGFGNTAWGTSSSTSSFSRPSGVNHSFGHSGEGTNAAPLSESEGMDVNSPKALEATESGVSDIKEEEASSLGGVYQVVNKDGADGDKKSI